MRYGNELMIAAENLAETIVNSPRLAAGVGVTTAGLGTALQLDWISGVLSCMAIVTGMVISILLGRLHLATVRNRNMEYKIMLRQYEQMGVEPITEKLHEL